MEWLSVVEFQYNDKIYVAASYIPFKLNFGRYSWKGDLTIKRKLPKLKDFLEELQKSQKAVKKLMEIAKEAIKKQFDKKRQNVQGLKLGDNIQLEAKNIQSK